MKEDKVGEIFLAIKQKDKKQQQPHRKPSLKSREKKVEHLADRCSR